MDVEKAVIGCLLLDINSIEKVYLNLSEDKFSDPYLGRIYHEIKKSYDHGLGADTTTLMFQLADLQEDVIRQLLEECVDSVSTSVKIEQYADTVIQCHKARTLGRMLNISPNAEIIDNQIADLIKQLEYLEQNKKETSQNSGQLADTFESQRGVETRSQGIGLGFHSIDEYIGGLDGGDVAIIGARPAVGKTAFALDVMLRVAKSGSKIDFFSLEMSNEQLYDRLISHESGIEHMRVKRALKYNDNEKQKISEANNVLRKLKDKMIFVDDVNTVSEIEMSIKRNKPDVVIVDYVQLVIPDSRYRGNRYAEVGSISHSFKALAKKMKIPIILLCQLNRVTDETKEPSMNELRESGDLEQDASVIILLWNKTEDKTQKGVKVDKSRNGRTGKTMLYFEGNKMRFSEQDEFRDCDVETPFT